MASIKDVSLKDLGKQHTGILHPMLTHRFMIQYSAKDLNHLQTECMTRQTTNFKTNFKKREISFDIEQPMLTDMIEAINTFVLSSGVRVTMCAMDGAGGVISKTEFVGQVVSHSFDLDYAITGAAKHSITVKYETLYVNESLTK